MFERLISGWLKIVSGNLVAGILRLIGYTIAARSLGVDALGVIVLIEAYVRVVDGLLNFQSVNVVTKFLAELSVEDDSERVRDLVKAGLLVDGGTALVTFVAAAALLPFVSSFIGLAAADHDLAVAFCAVIVTRILGTPEAVCRCLDRYWAIGMRETIIGLIMVSASLVAWFQQASYPVFLWIWLVAEATGNLVFLAWAVRALRIAGIRGLRRGHARRGIRASRGFWAMLWQTNLTFGIRVLSQQGDVVLAGAVLGPAAAALLRTAKNLVAVLSQLGRPLQQVASPEITRLWAAGERRRLLAYTAKICAAACGAGLVLSGLAALLGPFVLSLVFGESFAEATGTLSLLMVATSVYLAGVTLLPTMLTLELGGRFLRGLLYGTAVYVIALLLFIEPLGNPGIAVAHIVLNVVWAAYGWLLTVQRLRE